MSSALELVRRPRLAALGLTAVVAAAGCRTDNVIRKLDPDLNRMQAQPRYEAYGASAFFADGAAMRSPPEGTVPHGPRGGQPSPRQDPSRPPPEPPITLELLSHGREQFEIVCAACHGVDGTGNPHVVTHMARRPPVLEEERIRRLPNARIYQVIGEGYGLMPSYAAHLGPEDRWAVVAYVRALQRSRHAVVAQLPEPLERELEARAP